MRTIKFRAWDKDAEEMVYSDKPNDDYNFGFESGALKAWYTEFQMDVDGHAEPVSEELGVLMQFTGLLDKNGKEIYEGDIIRCSAVQRESNYMLENEVVEVGYSEKGYFYPFGYNAGWRSEVYDIELLGNIYEHPELLSSPAK